MREPPNFPPPRRTPLGLMTVCLALGLGAGIIMDRVSLLARVPGYAVSDFRLMAEAWNLISRYYVDRPAVKPTALTYGAISGMVDALGDTGHSAFIDPEQVRQLQIMQSGRLKGIGVEIQLKNRQVVIVAPLDDSPAQRAGLRSGDVIMSVNGHSLAGITLVTHVVQLIEGPVGTPVELSVLDPRTHAIRTLTLIRAQITIRNVTWRLLPGTDIAHLRIAEFDHGVADELRGALRAIQARGARGLILDLRDDPGGILGEAVSVASQFLSRGNVLLVRDAKGAVTPVPVQSGGLAPRLPLVVLIDNGTASAAEIVAGALDDGHRAQLVGTTTFGTGTVLSQFNLSDGSALMLAVQEWLTPDRHSFWHKGIPPAVTVALPPNVSPLFPAAEQGLSAAGLKASPDVQLARALELLSRQIGT